ncbi:hypothetical protein GCM10010336_49050 [Streptomyces goshikiensis]|nr:hypothetical protein GCM10010336_49050 [Streptomyces goshikiensis]
MRQPEPPWRGARSRAKAGRIGATWHHMAPRSTTDTGPEAAPTWLPGAVATPEAGRPKRGRVRPWAPGARAAPKPGATPGAGAAPGTGRRPRRGGAQGGGAAGLAAGRQSRAQGRAAPGAEPRGARDGA